MNAVSTEKQCNDLCIVEIAFREKRTERTVSHPACENFLLSRATFTLEVTTGETTRSSCFLFVFDRQREPVLAITNLS